MIVGPKNSNRLPSTWTEVTATYIAKRLGAEIAREQLERM